MDDLLQRMLAVEKEADELVSRADREAAAAAEQARGHLAEFVREFRAETARLGEQMVAEAVAEATTQREQALVEAAATLKADLEVFERAVAGRIGDLTRALAFPDAGEAAEGANRRQ